MLSAFVVFLLVLAGVTAACCFCLALLMWSSHRQRSQEDAGWDSLTTRARSDSNMMKQAFLEAGYGQRVAEEKEQPGDDLTQALMGRARNMRISAPGAQADPGERMVHGVVVSCCLVPLLGGLIMLYFGVACLAGEGEIGRTHFCITGRSS